MDSASTSLFGRRLEVTPVAHGWSSIQIAGVTGAQRSDRSCCRFDFLQRTRMLVNRMLRRT